MPIGSRVALLQSGLQVASTSPYHWRSGQRLRLTAGFLVVASGGPAAVPGRLHAVWVSRSAGVGAFEQGCPSEEHAREADGPAGSGGRKHTRSDVGITKLALRLPDRQKSPASSEIQPGAPRDARRRPGPRCCHHEALWDSPERRVGGLGATSARAAPGRDRQPVSPLAAALPSAVASANASDV
jgi:hypothetical protein